MSFITDAVRKADSDLVLKSIIEVDSRRNYSGVDSASVWEDFKAYRRSGGLFCNSPFAIIMYGRRKDGVVEFHGANSGTAEQLAELMRVFLRELSKTEPTAEAHYDIEKVHEVLNMTGLPHKVTRIDGGQHRTFRVEFDLREVS